MICGCGGTYGCNVLSVETAASYKPKGSLSVCWAHGRSDAYPNKPANLEATEHTTQELQDHADDGKTVPTPPSAAEHTGPTVTATQGDTTLVNKDSAAVVFHRRAIVIVIGTSP
jgi:hypothetical protein